MWGSAPGSGVVFEVRLLLLLRDPHGVRETEPGNPPDDAALIDLRQCRRGCNALIALAVEEITRKREKTISGEVTGVTRSEVTVKVKTLNKEDIVTVPANDVAGIAWSGEPPEFLFAISPRAGISSTL